MRDGASSDHAYVWGGPQRVANWTILHQWITVAMCMCDCVCLVSKRERDRSYTDEDTHHLNTVFLSMGEINEKASQND
jgi:hypothetical protein